MQSYGKAIRFDTSVSPIKMELDFAKSEAIRHKFVTDYGLRPSMEMLSLETSKVLWTFNPSTDEATFLMHLRTLTPAQYEQIELPKE